MSTGFIPIYDLETMSEPQRWDYVRSVCRHLNIPEELNLVMLAYLDEREGPRRLVAFLKRGGTEILRENRGISTKIQDYKHENGCYVVHASATDKNGRVESALGAKSVAGLTGQEYADAVMTAQTRAFKRATLQFFGAGVLDESEINPTNTIQMKQSDPIPVPPMPTVQPATEPGKDITPIQAGTDKDEELRKQAEWEAAQAKLRADAIAFLNAKDKPEPVQTVTQNPPVEGVSLQGISKPKAARKPRAPKTIDMGPSEPPIAPVPAAFVTASTVVTAPVSTVVPPVVSTVVPIAVQPPAPNKSKLTPDEVKPFRQRLFKVNNELELKGGFAPKAGLSNADKMRNFATMMFSDISNLNEMNAEQWEQYLTTLEQRIQTQGATATGAYIEDTIGV